MCALSSPVCHGVSLASSMLTPTGLTACGLQLVHDASGRSEFAWHPFCVVRTAGKGFGAAAARDIRAGERVLSEAPLAVWAVAPDATQAEKVDSFARLQATLDVATVDAVLTLSQNPMHGETPTLLGTWLTNGLPIHYDGGRQQDATKQAAVFANVCRINHSCAPNSHYEWNASLGMETVHALRDIARDEEISISYLEPVGEERAARQLKLRERFGFECACARCSLEGDELAASEARQRALRSLNAEAGCGSDSTSGGGGRGGGGRGGGLGDELLAERLRKLALQLRFMEHEGLPPVWLWKTQLLSLLEASMAELSTEGADGSLQRAIEWASEAAEALRVAVGSDHPTFELAASFVRMLEQQGQGKDSTAAQQRFFELASGAIGVES